MINTEIKKRLRIILFIITISVFIIFIKLACVQFIDNEFIYKNALDLWKREIPVTAKRGNIYDRNGKLLVGNTLTPSLACIPKQVEDKEEVAHFLSEVLNCEYSKIYKHLTKQVSIQLIKPEGRKITLEQAEKIIRKNYKGIYVVSDSRRFYPHDRLLSQVLGFTGIDNQGIAGIEYIYDEYLKGVDGALNIFTDAKGNLLEHQNSFYESGIQGMDLYLTVDLEVQLAVEQVLKEAQARYKPDQMLALVTNVKTGEILAQASYPNFDPLHYQDYSQEIINRNLPIWMSFEPGSTFKIVTFAAGIEEKKFKLDEKFFDPGYRNVAGTIIKDWKKGGHGSQTFLEVIQNSCNPGFMELGERLGTDKLFDYIYKFGFGKKTGVDLLGESTGIVFKKENVGPLELATSAFGQGNSTTPIQVVMAASAAVNNGYLLEPYILKKVQVPNLDETVYEKTMKIKDKVISNETSNVVRFALENVVAKGTGRSAFVEGYRVGGKTGTAQKVGENGTYLENNFILSFIGISPMNDPEICVYLAVDNPKNTIQYGGIVVAPMVGQIYEKILPILGIPRQDETQIAKELRYYVDPVYVRVPQFIGLDRNKVKHHSSYKIEIFGDGDKILAQLPSYNEKIKEGDMIFLYT